MSSVSFVLYIVTNRHWRSQNKPQGKKFEGGGRKLEAPEEEFTFIMTALIILILITVSVQIRRNHRLQSSVCGYLQGLLPQNSQLLV